VTAGKDTWVMPYFEVCEALAKYRQGQFVEAIDWAQKALKRSNVACLQAHACAVVAMAYWQLGEKAAAREMLAKGNALAPVTFPAREAARRPRSVAAWIIARISLDEATALVDTAAPQDK